MLVSCACDQCGSPATTHVTDASVCPAISVHYCEKHETQELQRTVHAMLHRIWSRPAQRSSAIDFVAAELAIARDEAEHSLETMFRRLQWPAE
jgi:hypothetical protein